MSYSSACFSTANVIENDMQQIEDNFDALRNHFANSTAPTSPQAGQFWYDTGTSSIKIRYNSSWDEFWDCDNHAVASGAVKTASLAAGALSTDAAGRAKMANGFIKSSHVADVDVTKVTNLNKSLIVAQAMPTAGASTGAQAIVWSTGDVSTAAKPMGRIYIPNSGAAKLRGTFWGGIGADVVVCKVTVGTCVVEMGTIGAGSESTYVDSSTYIDVTAFLGTLQNLSIGGDNVMSGLRGYVLYLTT